MKTEAEMEGMQPPAQGYLEQKLKCTNTITCPKAFSPQLLKHDSYGHHPLWDPTQHAGHPCPGNRTPYTASDGKDGRIVQIYQVLAPPLFKGKVGTGTIQVLTVFMNVYLGPNVTGEDHRQGFVFTY